MSLAALSKQNGVFITAHTIRAVPKIWAAPFDLFITWQITGIQRVIVAHLDYSDFRFRAVKAVECDTDVAHVDITMAIIYISQLS